jgi:hypothetical protein
MAEGIPIAILGERIFAERAWAASLQPAIMIALWPVVRMTQSLRV